MLAKVFSGTAFGIEGVLLDIEVDVAGRGFPTCTIVGLPHKSVDEAKDRVRTAVVNAGYDMPDSRITVNLAPADIPKVGSSLDLPIAVGILSAAGVINRERLGSSLFVGELSLEGHVRRVPGVISLAILAREKGIKHLFVPEENAPEASIISDVCVYSVKHLKEIISHINQKKMLVPVTPPDNQQTDDEEYEFDFADIKGQEQAKRAMEIAAVGFHNVHLTGVPGAGKTMISRAFPSILPPLSSDEVLEVSKIYSISGMLQNKAVVSSRPFRSPHHTTSRIGLIGGGSYPKPGEITLSHRGVLFLDEFPEFPRDVLEALRQPLEDGVVTISRASGSLMFPARFILVAASNPCPCGYAGHPHKSCTCLPGAILKYKKRLSGPMLDRIDLHVFVTPVDKEKLVSKDKAEDSKTVREKIARAHERQAKRFSSTKIKRNSEMSSSHVKEFCFLSPQSIDFLKQAITKLSLSARAYHKVVKVAQSIADLDDSDTIEVKHVAESLQYRR